jgi:uncharacterized protein DUF6928
MGWTFNCLLAKANQEYPLSPDARHNAPKAHDFLERCGLGPVKKTRIVSFDTALKAHKGWFGIGVYDSALLICNLEDLYNLSESSHSSLFKNILQLCSKGELLAAEIASSTNYFSYALFQDSVLQRQVSGDSSKGIYAVKGHPLAEEELFTVPLVKGQVDSALLRHGETVVFHLMARFLGKPFDAYASDKLSVELIQKAGNASLLSRLKARFLSFNN